MMDLCLLRLSYVLKQIASCVEALGSLGDAWEAREIRGTGAFLSGTSVHPPDAHCSEEEVGGGERNEDVVRRKKKDGPLVFTGKSVMLSDSESDAAEEIAGAERVPQPHLSTLLPRFCPNFVSRPVSSLCVLCAFPSRLIPRRLKNLVNP
ncbi:hypothetical protein, conserved [Trypanosoma vivax Y486]|uniref:Uncharacterized protein n=1 Tax=Trypanosoma vivax (strain Y486) TaxID=1055687 RepID=F9WLN4_TRYVY|nr:hypothetical protein, conserved [Trypanosoma vivax Y486]|eukprot:CCD18426.1 hypothetical protein, conserved [Trypanosoma vivax Y486]